ncbi:MAG: hypothetical protein HQ565_09445 [Bacteroidetes bacterium]|nr:hypothetical protein [Bacteroidota bacterium]
MERKQKIITNTAMWLAAFIGSIYGLFFTIIGAALDWGPGSGMEGPYWKIALTGLISLIIGIYIGELLVRKLSKMVFKRKSSRMDVSMLMFLTCTVAGLMAWILSWEAGYITGILLETIIWSSDMNWMEIIFNTLFMSSILGFPFYIGAGIISSVVSYIVLRK